jgi:hypothetical protein
VGNFDKLASLETLRLSGVYVSKALVDSLVPLKVSRLDIRESYAAERIVDTIAEMQYLESLSIRYDPKWSSFNTWVHPLLSLSNLHTLSCAGGYPAANFSLSDDLIKRLGKLRSFDYSCISLRHLVKYLQESKCNATKS